MMSYIDWSQTDPTLQKVLERGDYVMFGKSDAEQGKASAVASMPAQFQSAYTDGYNFGSYFRFQLNRELL